MSLVTSFQRVIIINYQSPQYNGTPFRWTACNFNLGIVLKCHLTGLSSCNGSSTDNGDVDLQQTVDEAADDEHVYMNDTLHDHTSGANYVNLNMESRHPHVYDNINQGHL